MSLIETVNKKVRIKTMMMKLAQHLKILWDAPISRFSPRSVRGKFCRSWSLTAVEHRVGSQRHLGADYWIFSHNFLGGSETEVAMRVD